MFTLPTAHAFDADDEAPETVDTPAQIEARRERDASHLSPDQYRARYGAYHCVGCDADVAALVAPSLYCADCHAAALVLAADYLGALNTNILDGEEMTLEQAKSVTGARQEIVDALAGRIA